MRLHVLGRLDLCDDRGERLQAILAQPKRCALLTYLAVREPGTSVLRDTLYGVFWPELSQNHARHALSQSLYGLRRALGPGVVQSGRGGQVGLSPSRFWCDAAALREALAGGRDAEALDLYRGDLLPGFFLSGDRNFESWLTLERELLRRAAAGAVTRLGHAAEREGRLDRAVAWAYRGVDLLPDDEIGLRRLITLLSNVGDRAAAARVYEAFAARLSADLELRPSPITEQLIASIRSMASPAEAPVAVSAPATASVVTAIPAGQTPSAAADHWESSASRRSAGGRLVRSVGVVLVVATAMIVLTLESPRGRRDQTTVAPGSDPAAAVAHPSDSEGFNPAGPVATRAAVLTRLGRFFSAQRTPTSLTAAIRHFDAAIASDSAYAPAYSGLADAYLLLSWYDNANPQVVGVRARDAALRAVALDANLAEAHASLGAVFAWVDGEGRLAEREYQRALGLDPRYAPARDWYALQLAARGRTDSAVAEATIAYHLDPTSLAIGADLATMLQWAGREQAAISQWRSTLALDSSFQRAHKQLWRSYALAGRWDAAVDELDRFLRLQGGPADVRAALHRVYADHGWQGVLEWRLRVLSDSAYEVVTRPVEAASLCVLLGRPEDALIWLKRAHDAHNQYLRFALLDPAFVSLRADPRFLALVPGEAGSF